MTLPTTAAADDSPAPNPPSSEAEAFALAAKTRQRTEIIDQREESAEVFANPDGTTTRRQYSTPVWSRYEGIWEKADATVVEHPDGTVGPASPTFGIAFSGGGTSPLATLTKGDKQLSLSWPTALPQPVLDGNTALYKSVLPDVDLKVIAEVDGFSEHLIVNTPQAAANPAMQSIKLGVATKGVTLADDDSDNLTATDAVGNVVFSAPSPKMWEQPDATDEQPTGFRSAASASMAAAGAVDEPESAPVAADVSGDTLTLTPDPTLLATADQFPLVVDPVFTGGYREKWAVVYSATPSDAYPNGSGWHSGTPSDEPRVGFNDTGATRSFFAMNTDGLKDADILDATFSVVETHSWGCDASVAGPTELWSTSSISTTPTWNNQPDWVTKLDSDSYAHGNPTYCPGDLGHDYKTAALTTYVQQAADSGAGTVTFGLRAPSSYEDDHNSFKRFTNSPALEVTYNYKPTVADHDAFEGSWSPSGDGNKPVPCGDVIGNSGLAMTAKLADKDGGKVTGYFSVTNTATNQPVSFPSGYPSSDQVSNGQTASVVMPASKLPTGSYSWKVHAVDEEDTDSGYTTSCAFRVDKIGPTDPVVVTNTDGTAADEATDKYPGRKTVQLKLYNFATDVAGFCWTLDSYLSASSTRCANGTWVAVGADHHTATINVIPSGWPSSTLHVVAYDAADNHSPLDKVVDATTLSTTPSAFVYASDKDPGQGLAHQDLPGDLNGDGYADMVATDNTGKLRLYAGDGTGHVAAFQTVGNSGWTGALIAHRGDLVNFASPTQSPDGYEDFLVRLSNNKLYLYGGNGLGSPNYNTRREIVHPGTPDWSGLIQIIAPGNIDGIPGNDFITTECSAWDTNGNCTNAKLWLYSGNAAADGSQDQTEPFLLQPTEIGGSGWMTYTNLATGDVNGDGVDDILGRKPSTGQLLLYPGVHTGACSNTPGVRDCTYSLQTPPTTYGSSGWQNRPHLASPGNIQGTVSTRTYSDPDAGTDITYRQFQPTSGDTYGDLWATTPADPNYTVNYVDDTGTAQTTTCPSGCLLFYPGRATALTSPHLVGSSNWEVSITGIF
ncbi:FG-GAP repeat domain-containing protein [Streptomyces sp. NPDC001220]